MRLRYFKRMVNRYGSVSRSRRIYIVECFGMMYKVLLSLILLEHTWHLKLSRFKISMRQFRYFVVFLILSFSSGAVSLWD
jgi:hypothetical protein